MGGESLKQAAPGLQSRPGNAEATSSAIGGRSSPQTGWCSVSLSTRTILSVSATLLALLVVVYFAASKVLLRGFGQVELALFSRHAERGQEAVLGAAEVLSNKVADWANWDDTYEFVRNHNAAYIQSNLSGASLASLGVRFVLFMDVNGKLVEAASIDPETQEATPLPRGIEAMIRRGHPLLQVHGDGAPMTGLIPLAEGVFVVASRPIKNSQMQGPIRGTIIFGDLISDARVEEMSRRLRATVSLVPINGTQTAALDAERLDRVARLAEAGKPTVTFLGDDVAVGSALLPDIDGSPAFLVEVMAERFVWQEAKRTTSLLLTTLAIAGTGAVLITMFVLRVVVLRRLARLHSAVHGIGRSGDLARRVPAEGTDELAELGQTVNELLDRVATSQTELSTKADALVRAGEDLRCARDAAEAASRAKSEILANMSHEVRTPMTAILGYADVLADQATQPGFRPDECVETIRRNAKHLLTIINDILDLSKIEAGRMQIERTDCAPARIAAEAIELLRENAAGKHLELRLEFATPMPLRVVSDPTRLRQIFLNLVGNAIKFTIDGSVTLRLACDVEGRRLVAEVIDSGIGMTPEQAGRLFQPFSQANASTSRLFGGTGLGLSISRRLAQLLGGSLELASTGPHGSTFRLTVETGPLEGVSLTSDPLAASAAPAAIPLAPKPCGGELTGLRLLLAEDGPDNQRLIGFVLGKAGAEVVIVGDGRAAVDAIHAATHAGTPFDVVLMDMQMPVLDGYGATRELRTRGVRTPVLALTAHAMEGDRNQCLAAGCDDYETKPIDRLRLVAACARLAKPFVRRAA